MGSGNQRTSNRRKALQQQHGALAVGSSSSAPRTENVPDCAAPTLPRPSDLQALVAQQDARLQEVLRMLINTQDQQRSELDQQRSELDQHGKRLDLLEPVVAYTASRVCTYDLFPLAHALRHKGKDRRCRPCLITRVQQYVPLLLLSGKLPRNQLDSINHRFHADLPCSSVIFHFHTSCPTWFLRTFTPICHCACMIYGLLSSSQDKERTRESYNRAACTCCFER